jgi:hypothetical protein
LLPGVYTATAPATHSGYLLSSSLVLTCQLTIGQPQYLGFDFGYAAPTGVLLAQVVLESAPHAVRLGWTAMLPAGIPTAPSFDVWRAIKSGEWIKLTAEPVPPLKIAVASVEYAYRDESVLPGVRYSYRLAGADGAFYGPWEATTPPAVRRSYLPWLATEVGPQAARRGPAAGPVGRVYLPLAP